MSFLTNYLWKSNMTTEYDKGQQLLRFHLYLAYPHTPEDYEEFDAQYIANDSHMDEFAIFFDKDTIFERIVRYEGLEELANLIHHVLENYSDNPYIFNDPKSAQNFVNTLKTIDLQSFCVHKYELESFVSLISLYSDIANESCAGMSIIGYAP